MRSPSKRWCMYALLFFVTACEGGPDVATDEVDPATTDLSTQTATAGETEALGGPKDVPWCPGLTRTAVRRVPVDPAGGVIETDFAMLVYPRGSYAAGELVDMTYYEGWHSVRIDPLPDSISQLWVRYFRCPGHNNRPFYFRVGNYRVPARKMDGNWVAALMHPAELQGQGVSVMSFDSLGVAPSVIDTAGTATTGSGFVVLSN